MAWVATGGPLVIGAVTRLLVAGMLLTSVLLILSFETKQLAHNQAGSERGVVEIKYLQAVCAATPGCVAPTTRIPPATK